MENSPPTLLSLLRNPLLLDLVAFFLPFHSRLALASTSKEFYDLILHTPQLWRCLDFPSSKWGKFAFNALITYLQPTLGGTSLLEYVHTLILDDQIFGLVSLRGILFDKNSCIKLISLLGSDAYFDPDEFRELIFDLMEAYEHDGSLRPISGIYYFGMRPPEHSLQCPKEFQKM